MSNLNFIGKDQPEVKSRENATLIFECNVTPSGDETIECAVGFDIEEFAACRFDKEFAGSSGRVPWYAYWQPVIDEVGNPLYEIDDPSYVQTKGENYKFKPSMASMFRLTYLQMLGMRKSEGYKEAIRNLPEDKFSEEQKQQLLYSPPPVVTKENIMDLHLFENRNGTVDVHELVNDDLIHVDSTHRNRINKVIDRYLEECHEDRSNIKTTEYIEKIRVLDIVSTALDAFGINEDTLRELVAEVESYLTLPE